MSAVLPGRKDARQNEMRALADGEQRVARTAIERDRFLRVNSAGIDDDFGLQVEDGAVFAVLRLNAGDFAAALNQARRFNVIDGSSAQILEGTQQRDGIAGVVKLAVVIENAAAKVFCP